MTNQIFETIHAMPLAEKFKALRDGAVEDVESDELKALAVLGLSLLEQLLNDLHRSANALEAIAAMLTQDEIRLNEPTGPSA